MKKYIVPVVLVILVTVCLIYSSPVVAQENTHSGYSEELKGE
jgi:hypothetical protein